MKIKNRLAFYFSLISSAALLTVMVIIYIAFYSFFLNDFYGRLATRARVAADVYLNADEITADSLLRVKERYVSRLHDEVIRIYDRHNTAIYIRDNQQYWGGNVINEVRRRHYVQFMEGQRQTVGIFEHDNQGDYVILASALDAQGYTRLNDLLEIMAVLFVVLNGILFFVGRLFAQQSLSPIDAVVSQMQRITASNLHLRVDEGNGRDEISELAQNFNRLLEHLQNAFELQQTFVANASHELRTPVTSIIGEIEVALNRQRSSGDYRDTLHSVLTDAGRLKETIASLMELAQADMQYTQATLGPVQVDELLWELGDYWTARMGERMLLINILHLPEDQQHLFVAANKSLLAIAINNIISNAYKFSDNRPVSCALYVDDALIRLSISDQGIGIPEADAEKIFHSFYRSPNGRMFQGSGVGLYVTQKIIQLFKGTIRIQSQAEGGTVFTIEFSHL